MIRKLFTGGVAIAVALAAILLVTVTGTENRPAEAAITEGPTADSLFVSPGGQTTIRINADPSAFGDQATNQDRTISVRASAGTLVPRNHVGPPNQNPSGNGCAASPPTPAEPNSPCAYNHGGLNTAQPNQLVRLMGWNVDAGLLDIDHGGAGGTGDDDCFSCAQGMRVEDGFIDVNRNGVLGEVADNGTINGFQIITGRVDLDFSGGITANDNSRSVDRLALTFTAPATPGSVSITACQPTAEGLGAPHPPAGVNFQPQPPDCRVLTINVGGGPNRIAFEIVEWNNPAGPNASPAPVPGTATACTPVEDDVLDAAGAANGNDGQPGPLVGQLCAIVYDASNNPLANHIVNFTITPPTTPPGGTAQITCNPGPIPVPAGSDTTSPTGGPTTRCWIHSGTAGSIVRVTAAASGVNATDDVRFGGNPASCEIVLSSPTLSTNNAVQVTVNVFDVSPPPTTTTAGAGTLVPTTSGKANPAPDHTIVTLQVSGGGSVLLVGNQPIELGSTTFQVIAPTAGPVSIGATAPGTGAVQPQSNAIHCSTAVQATGEAGAAGTCAITGGTKPPASGGFGLFVIGTGCNNASMEAAACGGATTDAYWVTKADGTFVQYVPSSTVAVVNQEWGTTVSSGGTPPRWAAGTLPAGQPIIGKCV